MGAVAAPTRERGPIGWLDTGRPEGSISTVEAKGDPVPVAFRNLEQYSEVGGSGGATANASSFTSNPDGTGSGLTLATGAIGTGNCVRTIVPFFGRCFGVRWQGVYTAPDFDVKVDGESVAVDAYPEYLFNRGIDTEITHDRAQVVTHDYLAPDVWHVAEITLVGDAAATKSLLLFGVLLDRGAGYRPPEDFAHFTAEGTLTASQVAIPLTNSANDRAIQAIHEVRYTNTDSSARVVTVKEGSEIIAALYLAASGATGDSQALTFPKPVVGSSTLTHAASLTAVVTYKVIGDY